MAKITYKDIKPANFENKDSPKRPLRLFHFPSAELPKKGRPLVVLRYFDRFAFIGARWDGHYFRWRDYRICPSAVEAWVYKTEWENRKKRNLKQT